MILGGGAGGVIILRVYEDLSEAKLGSEPRSFQAKCWVFPPAHITLLHCSRAYLEKDGAGPRFGRVGAASR